MRLSKIKLLADRALEAPNPMNNRGRWRIGALASAIALLGSLASLEAHALALGRITVQSALGEPLRAEIDIADINAEEAASLKAGIASMDTFKAAGLEYTAALTGLEINLQRRADGRSYLRLTSSRPVTEPFVDLILEANWSAGRITRDYTMLFDPPNLRQGGSPVTPTAPVLSSRPTAPAVTPVAREPAVRPSVAASPVAPQQPPAARAPVAKAPPAEKAPSGDKKVTVKTGDTAGKIAAQTKQSSVSLDQMLVALLRSNPDAFIGGNINRIKSGAVLDIPSTEAANAVSASEASQTIVAQSNDFNAFRRKLAEGAPTTQVASADRQAGGKVQAKVEDRAPANATPDKLTLSKGAVQGKAGSAAEDKIAKDRQAKDASTRVAELSKNIGDLNKLNSAPAAAAVPAAAAPIANAASAAKVPGLAVPAPSSLPVPVSVPAVAASAPKAPPAPAVVPATPSAPVVTTPAPMPAASMAVASMAPASAAVSTASAPAAPASQPVAVASAAVTPAVVAVKPPVVQAPPPPPPETSLIDDLLANPLVLPLGGLLLALLAGFGFYRYRQRNGSPQVDSSFLESRLQPDSFFGASGGQRIDTKESNVTGSSLVYSPSQLDAAGDVDPVAEADVYLAYGRDLQAEEILKEAVRTNPTRVAIHAKLLEIYAKRRDSKAYEIVALDAFNLTNGFGPEWAYITEMGRELDATNPLYQPGGQPGGGHMAPGDAALSESAIAAQVAQWSQPASATGAAPAMDLDLDLDFSLDDAPASAANGAARTAEPAALMSTAPERNDAATDFDQVMLSLPTSPSSSFTQATRAVETAPLEMSFPDDGLTFTPEPFSPVRPVAAAPSVAPSDSGMMEFDMGSLSLDLPASVPEIPAPAAVVGSDNPLETKFSLAEEFRTLGDTQGARLLSEEVVAKASGALKVKAQAFLNTLT